MPRLENVENNACRYVAILDNSEHLFSALGFVRGGGYSSDDHLVGIQICFQVCELRYGLHNTTAVLYLV